MTNAIVNAAPLVRDYGTQDLSTRQLPRVAEAVPQHLPKSYLFAQRGTTDVTLAVGIERENIFGAETFNLIGAYANHSTVFANVFNTNGNQVQYQRVIPEDAGPKANIFFWLDVLPTTVDIYERNSDGSIKTTSLGEPIITGTAAGYKVKWVVTNALTATEAQAFGARTQVAGDQVDPITNTQSTRYPMFDLSVNSQGGYGNNMGVRLWAPTSLDGQLPTKLMTTKFAYPYNISVIEKQDGLTTPSVKSTILGEQNLQISFKQGVIDPSTSQRLYAGDLFVQSYSNTTDPRYPKVYADFDGFHIYQANIDTLVGLFHAAEVPFIDGNSDFGADAAEAHLFNFVSGTNSSAAPYNSFVFVDSVDSLRLSQYTNVYAKGGSDGTMSDEVFAALVSADVLRYADRSDEYQDKAYYVESILYDSGFPLQTKLDLAAFISQRRDTTVIWGTYIAGGGIQTPSEENAIAVAIRTRAQGLPESDYFGTSVMRGAIFGRSALIRNSQWIDRVPVCYEVANQLSIYMGAANGRWTTLKEPDGAPGSIITTLYDISYTWVPDDVRNRNWDIGLNWVQRYDRSSFFFPALHSLMSDDTSVLSSLINVLAVTQLNKVAHAAWREFSGVSKYTPAQLIDRVNAFARIRVANKFDDRYTIEPDTIITEMDDLRGYSWTLVFKFYANNSRTVMTTYTQAYRLSDLTT